MSCSFFALKALAILILYYLFRKAKEFTEPAFSKNELISLLYSAGIKRKFAQNGDPVIALAFANQTRVKSFCNSNKVKDLNFRLSGTLPKFLKEAESEIRKQPDARKASKEYKIFRKMYKTCKAFNY